jgi:hypothetical protein
MHRYLYYIPQRENKEHAGASGLPRLPAAELESAVLDQLRAILRSDRGHAGQRPPLARDAGVGRGEIPEENRRAGSDPKKG